MSWLAKSLVNSLKVLDDDNEEQENNNNNDRVNRESPKDKEVGFEHQIGASEETHQGRGVKDDLSEITKTLTRQLWGVASFLAPPPSDTSSPSHSPKFHHPPPAKTSSSDPSISDWNKWESSDQTVSRETSDPENSDSTGTIAGIRSDFAEIGGKFKTGISKLSNHKAVSEISKIASNFLPFGSSEEISVEKYSVGGAVGVTDEVLTFTRNIAMHPETWLDFPLDDDEDSDDFDMSDAQQDHALAIENLAPRLAALRMELCPGYMSEGCFWKIYFVLLHSRLNKHDAEVLSTPQIEEARAMLTQELHAKTKQEPDHTRRVTNSPKESASSLQEEHQSATFNAPPNTAPLETFTFEPKSSVETTDIETEKHPVVSREMPTVDKTVVEEPVVQNKDEQSGTSKKELHQIVELVVQNKDEQSGTSKKVLHQKDEEEDADDWLEESTEMDNFSGANIPVGNDEDVSFSDLEEDDDDEDERVTSSSEKVDQVSGSCSSKDPQGWVQLSKNTDDSINKTHSIDRGSVGSDANKPKNKVSSDWLDVDDIDMA